MIYTKPVADITWNDIEEFCNQKQAEGAYLDYKEDFPKDLAKTIAAMANTFGGIILIGVREDKESKPITPVDGISFARGLSERVMNIILDSITPPIFPEVQVCLNTDKTHAAVVIRIAQSHEFHAISSNTSVYLRTVNRNKPEELARVDQIEWLRGRRAKSEQLREKLYVRANDRAATLYGEGYASRVPMSEITQGWLTLSLCPLFPKEPFGTPPTLRSLQRKIEVSNHTDSVHANFPPSNQNYERLVQDGFVFNATSARHAFHTELNCFGLYFYKQSLAQSSGGDPSSQDDMYMNAGEIMMSLDQFIESATKFYQELSYWGTLDFQMRLDSFKSCDLNSFLRGSCNFKSKSPCLDTEIEFSRTVPSAALKDEKPTLVLGAIQQIGWAFGWNVPEDIVDVARQQLGF